MGMGMGVKSWIDENERLRLEIKSYTKEWELNLSPEIQDLNDCDRELSPLLWNENGTQVQNWRKSKTGTGN